MPSALMTLDTSRPSFSGQETVEEKVDALQNYVLLLLENLRYLLGNLGPENMNQTEVVRWLQDEGIEALPDWTKLGDTIVTNMMDTIITNTLITDELYADYGEIADLVVSHLRTDFCRATNYKTGNRSDIDYISIHDEVIEFCTDSFLSAEPVPMQRFGRQLYWMDEGQTLMTTRPEAAKGGIVYCYQYRTRRKGKIEFQSQSENGQSVKYPVFQFGEGNDIGRNIGKIVKDVEGFRFLHSDVDGNQIGLRTHYQGGAEAPGLLWFGTKAEYENIGRKNNYTTYFLEES